jgi:2'-5' RNA ligase
MRIFVGIEIPSDIRQRIRELIEVLQRGAAPIRWSRVDGMHITLKFIGDAPAEKVDQIKVALQAVSPVGPVSIRIQGAGYFPSERAPRVVWLGVQADPQLAELAEHLEQGLVPLGVPKEDRLFAPHLTIGRLRTPAPIPAVRELLRQREPLDLGAFTAREFCLYDSQRLPDGSIYKRLARFPLSEPVREEP